MDGDSDEPPLRVIRKTGWVGDIVESLAACFSEKGVFDYFGVRICVTHRIENVLRLRSRDSTVISSLGICVFMNGGGYSNLGSNIFVNGKSGESGANETEPLR